MKSEPKNPSWNLRLEELVAGTEGKVLSQYLREYRGVGTDTREDLTGKVFFALKGDTFDAHDFLPQAVASGAGAIVVHRLPENAKELLEQVTIVETKDTLLGIQKLANFWRRKMKAKIVGVTGTNGKTTTKEFAASVLGSKFSVQYSKGSFNNHWGVPISLLSVDRTHDVAVIEMGMNHPGELTLLSKIAEPDAVLVTMVGRGHLEGVGTIEGAARAKAEIYQHAPEHSIRIFNLENDHTRAMYETWGESLSSAKVITFAGAEYAERTGLRFSEVDIVLGVVSAGPDSLRVRGEIRGVADEILVPVFGRHNVTNIMSAAAFALACGMSPTEVWNALPNCRTAWGRNQWVQLKSGAKALFDAYNANPESMRAALENFAGLTVEGGGRKIAVLGEMRELGEQASGLHRELGEIVARSGFEEVCFFGPSHEPFAAGLAAAGFNKKLYISNTYEQKLAPHVLPVLDRNDIVLIKGSRGMQLEKVLSDLDPVEFRSQKQ